jgi:hypothetical protein
VDELIAKGIADDERPQGGAVIVKIDEKLGTEERRNIARTSSCALMARRCT